MDHVEVVVQHIYHMEYVLIVYSFTFLQLA